MFVDDAHASGVLGRQRAGHGRPLRAPRPGRDPGRHAQQGRRRARRLRRRVAGPPRHPHPAGAPVPLLDVAIRRRSRPPASRRSGSWRRSPSSSSACGRTPAGSRPSSAGSASTRASSETPITPVMMGDSATAGRFSDRLLEEGVFAQPVVFPTVALDKAPHPDDRDRRPHGRDARYGARRVRPGGPRARARRRVTEPVGQARDLPLDSHLHTDLSPDSDVPIDVYAALARGARDRRARDHRPRGLRSARSGLSTTPRSRIASGASARRPSGGRSEA